MRKLTTILTGLAFGAAMLCLAASAIGQETQAEAAGDEAAAEAVWEKVLRLEGFRW